MIKSELTNKVVEASASNYTHGRKGYKVCKITPHHMAGVLSGEQCAKMFQNEGRQASANYCIGNDGEIVLSVAEENRAWTSANQENDCQAITIEVSNCENGGDWRVSDAAWNSLVKLCVDICKRYNFRLIYDGTKNGSLTRHNMFVATSCPGPYLQSRFQELADTVNAQLDEKVESTPSVPSERKSNETIAQEVIQGLWGNGEDRRNRLISAGYNYQTIQDIVNSLMNSHSLNTKKSNEQIAQEVLAGVWGNGEDRKNRLQSAGYNYNEVQAKVNALCNVKVSNRKSNETIAREVIQGLWGNGDTRRVKLSQAGYDFNAIQSIVNRLLK